MAHSRSFESGLLPTTLRKRKLRLLLCSCPVLALFRDRQQLQLLLCSGPTKAGAFTLKREQKLELSLTFPAF